jgi:hypothetical protein
LFVVAANLPGTPWDWLWVGVVVVIGPRYTVSNWAFCWDYKTQQKKKKKRKKKKARNDVTVTMLDGRKSILPVREWRCKKGREQRGMA